MESKRGSFFDDEEFKAKEAKPFQIWATEFPAILPKDIRCQGELSLSDDPKDQSQLGQYVLTKRFLYKIEVGFP